MPRGENHRVTTFRQFNHVHPGKSVAENILMAIDSKLSIVVQGPVDHSISSISGRPVTQSLCQTIRRILPCAELIVSTWDGEDIDGLSYDVLLQNRDPGSQGVRPGFIPNNVNRQIISTSSGLKAAQREFALKIRTDMELVDAEFLDTLPRLDRLPGAEAVFSHRVLSSNLSSRNPEQVQKRLPGHWLLFHPSDHLHAGYRDDLLALWDTDLQSTEDATYFLGRFRPNKYRDNELSRLTPEQHIFTTALRRKNKNVELRDYGTYSKALLVLSKRMTSMHFKHIPDRLLPIRFHKYHTAHHFSFDWMRITDV